MDDEAEAARGGSCLRRSDELQLCHDLHISILARYTGSDGGQLTGTGTGSLMSGGSTLILWGVLDQTNGRSA